MATLTLRPNGNGNQQGWNAEGGDYTRIDEVTSDGDTTRLYSPTDNVVATFAMEDHVAERGVINSVTVYINTKGADPISNTVQLAVRVNGTDYFSSDQTYNNTSYHLESNTWSTSPDTSSAWTWDEVDAMECGMKRITGGGQAVTQVYAVVDYTAATVEQEGFRWRDDDGSESGASWLASQDTDISRAIETATRLRILANATNNIGAIRFGLQYVLNGNSDWRTIESSYTATYVDEDMSSSPATGTLGGNAAWNASGYLRLTQANNGERGEIYYSGELPTAFTCTFDAWAGGGNGADAVYFFFGSTELNPNEETSTGGYTIALSEYHDEITLRYNGTAITSYSITTLDNSTWRTVQVIRDGNDFTIKVDGSTVISYTDTTRALGGTYYGWGARTGGLNNEHRVKNITLVNDASAPAFLLSASSNITASGENTTAQLTAPSGKTTGDFVAGRIQDDENPTDSITMGADEYTELEWCIEATTDATDTATYDFRITDNGTAISTYTVTPQWTIGTTSPSVFSFLSLLGVG